MLKCVVVLAGLMALTTGFIRKQGDGSLEEYLRMKAEEGMVMDVVEKNHTTRVDHFNLRDKRNFTLRYWENNSYFTGLKKNVMLYLCGEWTCSYPSNAQYYDAIAQV